MVDERLEELDELAILVELELLFHYVGIFKAIKNYNVIFIQDYKNRSKCCNSTTFSSHLWHWLDLGMNHSQIDCTHVIY